VLVVILLLCFILTVPIAISLGFASMIFEYQNDVPLTIIVQRLFTSLDSFPLLAVPFFILAGTLMERGGISKRLIDLANSFVGSTTGGLAIVTIVASMFFSAMSGSGPATTAAIGSIMIPAMVARGYDKGFASATQATAGEIGVIIPPSIPMILFGIVGGVSIGDLFLAGFLPGILVGLSLMVVAYLTSKKRNYVGDSKKATWKERGIALRKAFLALLMPVIILGGIYGGVFTPTEAAVVATVYALVVGLFMYKEIKWKDLTEIFYKSAMMSAIILLIVANAGLFSWIMTSQGIPQMAASWFSDISNPIVFLLLINVLLLVIGMFFDAGAAILIMVPILLPIAISLGIDPIHFGIIMIVNLAMGMITPPIGVNLFVVCEIANIKIEKVSRALVPYFLIMIVDLLLISYIPQISTFLPNLLKH
jgi:C4-dicarboxylate transporter DctM subunit